MPPRKNVINKSQAIREMLEQKPGAKAREIVEELAQRHIPVKPSQVYMVKGRLTQIKSQQRRKASRGATSGNKTGISDPVTLILKVKGLAHEAGGLNNLKALISALAE